MPWPLQEAINHGLAILSWFEGYTGNELPDENIWDDSDAIDAHFKDVRARKGLDGDDSAYSKADDNNEEMTGNELARVFKS